MGFVNPVASLLEGFGIEKDGRGNAKATTDGEGCYATNVPKVFAAGDACAVASHSWSGPSAKAVRPRAKSMHS